MNFGRRSFLAAGLVVALAAGFGLWSVLGPSGDPATRLRADDRALVAQGAQIYLAHCAACHGAQRQGQPDWKARSAEGLLPAPPHDDSGHTWHHADQILFEITKYGVQRFAGADYRTDMPRYEGILDDGQIVAALSYLKSRWGAQARARQERINESALRAR